MTVTEKIRKIRRFHSASIDFIYFGPFTIWKHVDSTEKFSISRGRLKEIRIVIPVTKRYHVEFHTKGKTYLELVGGPKYLKNINWIIDEFDSSFNALAVASLKYHMHHSVAVCQNPEKFQDLIDRLSEPFPEFTDEEMVILDRHPMRTEPIYNKDGEVYAYRMLESHPEEKEVYAAHNIREDEYNKRMNQARHDFIDIVPWLWS